jgi:HrpA-like RNA helicase
MSIAPHEKQCNKSEVLLQVIVVDEVHERHLSTDLLLGLLKSIMAERPDLRIILMSATIDLAR